MGSGPAEGQAKTELRHRFNTTDSCLSLDLFFFGLILALVGVYLTVTRPGTDFLAFAMAAVFFVMSAGSYKRYRDGCVERVSPGA